MAAKLDFQQAKAKHLQFKAGCAIYYMVMYLRTKAPWCRSTSAL